jgi:nitrite reductase (NADH) large subunit
MSHYVIIGSGNAGVTAAETIREYDKKCKITLINGESKRFYFRSSLLEFIKGEIAEEQMMARPKKFYQLKNIDLLDNIRAQKIVPETKQVIIDKDNIIKYDKLLIATGAVTSLPNIKGTELRGVKTCRSFADVQDIIELAKHSKNVVVIGGGILGIELADALSKKNNRVTLLEAETRLGGKLFDPCTALRVLEELHKKRIDVRLKEGAKELRGREDHVSEVRTTKGKILKTNLVIFCTGMRPNVNFLHGSGLDIEKGILVDNTLKTNDNNIYAAGDVAQVNVPEYGEHVLRQNWYESAKMGEVAALNMIGESATYYPAVRYHCTNITGIPYACIGELSPKSKLRKEYEVMHSNCKKTNNHKLFILKRNKITGASFFGERNSALIVKELAEKGVDVSSAKKQLLEENFDFYNLLPRISEEREE